MSRERRPPPPATDTAVATAPVAAQKRAGFLRWLPIAAAGALIAAAGAIWLLRPANPPPAVPAVVSYQVADNAEPHRSYTTTGVKLFIVD